MCVLTTKKIVQFLVVLLCISLGSCLQCYKCYDTGKHCLYGDTKYLGVLNCSSPNEICATFRYELDDSSVSYVTTIRGCQPVIKDGICNQLMQTRSNKKVVQKGIYCKTCDTDLCNSATTKNMSFSAFWIIFLLVISRVSM